MHVVIFEGSRWSNFAPLSLTQPVFMLECGLDSLLHKQIRALKPSRLSLWVRPGLIEYCRRFVVPTTGIPTTVNEPLDDERALLVSGRCLFFAPYEHHNEQYVVMDEDDSVIRKASVVSPGLSCEDVMNRTDRWMKVLDLPHSMPQSRLVRYVWDLIAYNEEALVADTVRGDLKPASLGSGAYHVIHPENLFLGEGVSLEPGVVLDASRGPIVIGRGAKVGANSVVQGPCGIGAYATISPLSTIRPGTTIGTQSKIGGEVSNSIVCAFSNKAHEGYLGDSYVGSWVNLGAGTTTSNLKNTYGPISMMIGGRETSTGRRFLGSMIGEHSKTAIGTRLNTGTYIGCCSSLAAGGMSPRFVPSFTFLTDRGAEPYDLDKAKQVMTAVFARRNRTWTELDDTLLNLARQTAFVAES